MNFSIYRVVNWLCMHMAKNNNPNPPNPPLNTSVTTPTHLPCLWLSLSLPLYPFAPMSGLFIVEKAASIRWSSVRCEGPFMNITWAGRWARRGDKQSPSTYQNRTICQGRWLQVPAVLESRSSGLTHWRHSQAIKRKRRAREGDRNKEELLDVVILQFSAYKLFKFAKMKS